VELFRKTETVGTLASQADIGGYDGGASVGSGGITPQKNFENCIGEVI